MRKMTEENLKSAFAGESQAYMRYLIFSEKAEEEGFKNVGKIFRAIAYAEQVHATNHYNVLGMIRNTVENLQEAINGETFEVNEMYPAYNVIAKLQDERGAQRTTEWALQAEKIHAAIYQKARQAVESGRDVQIDSIYVCSICGYTSEEEIERCPICGAPKEKIKKF
ncbi:MAG: rubrerythrin family protein [Candidatus Jordarchaeaceae archaeon]